MQHTGRLVVAVTGASGAPYALRFLREALSRFEEVFVCFSDQALQVMQLETGVTVEPAHPERVFGSDARRMHVLEKRDFFSPPASGSFRHDGMVIVPCSMGVAGRIANGVSDDLVTRCADVCLKERRPLILVPRESPLSLVHLRNLTHLAEAGAVILPAAPGFYHRPATIDDLVCHVVARILQQLGVEQTLIPEWQTGAGASSE